MARKQKTAMVLGAYGLIGSVCVRALIDAGFSVIGVGRSRQAAEAFRPEITWLMRDIPEIETREWEGLLRGVDVVVNAAGALQDGASDNLEAIHVAAVERLVEAARGLPVRIVQISAAGVSVSASTEFFRSKARGDVVLQERGRDWVILRPTLVLSPDAYGGTALLRAVAAVPLIQPRVMPYVPVQTIHVDDLAAAVVLAARRKVPAGLVADLTEREARSFSDLVDTVRRWQGLPEPLWKPDLPSPVLEVVASAADLAGRLGWRSPLRSNALVALADGVRGDPTAWEQAGGATPRALGATLSALPSTRQERMFARMYLAIPAAIVVLALFWIASGVIALVQPAQAMAVMDSRNVPGWISGTAVFGGAVVDVGLGISILWRAWAQRAALGMVIVSLAYLVGSVIFAPDLWADPLGPMVKVVPGMVLAGIVALVVGER